AGRPAEALAVLRQAVEQQGGGNPVRVAALARMQAAADAAQPAPAPEPEPPPAPEPADPPADPPEAEDLCALGLRLVAAGCLAEAAEAYGRGLELAPNSGRLRFNQAKLRLRQGQDAAALADLAAAARLGLLRQDWELLVEAARLLEGLERRDQAVALLRQVLRLAPDQAVAAALLAELAPKETGRPAGDGPGL
ncbi:MAG: hypothetical protein V1797_18030, partial [Pseudomonadota bacterium]